MADLVRAYDWASTSLGSIESWSKELVTIVNLTLCSPSPARTMWGPDFVLIYNDAYRPIPGPRHPFALGKSAKQVYTESWHIVGPLLEKAFATGETFYYEKLLVPLPTSRGVKNFYLNYSFNPISENGRIAGLFGPLHDVTGEVTAVRQLRESEARANRILQSIGDAVIVTDADACITRMNPIAEHLTGWSIAEAICRPLSEVFNIFSETTRKPVESPAEKVRRLGTIVGLANHTILAAKDGTETHIDDSGAPIRNDDGDLIGIVLVFRDINERRAAEHERDVATAQLHQVLETTTDAIISVDRNWRISYRNAPATAVVAPIDPFIGRPFWETFPLAFYEGSPYVEHYNRAMNEGIAGQFDAHYPDPLDIWVQVNVRPSPDGIVIFFRDITQQRRAEAALVQTEKLAAVGRLASSIAHEINNPLESVMNLIYLARQSAVNEQAQQYLDSADQEIRRVSVIANQTLRFHKQPSNPRAITGSDLFSSVLGIYEGRFKNSSIQIEKRFRSDQPVVVFEGDIRQVLNNLVANAIDAMPNGGRLLIRNRKATDSATGRAGLVLTVADTGCGMDREVLSNIFEPFFTTKGIAGTGLGLWVSQEIVDRHNGILKVRSSQREATCGTVFTLFLPFETEHA